MSTSKEVFALRKEGSLDAAYAMALEIVEDDPYDEWNIKALAYCLNDLIKRAASQNDYPAAQQFALQLANLQIDESDDILVKTVQKAQIIANPLMKIILDAKKLSFDGKDQEAHPLFKRAIELFPTDRDLAKSYGWTINKLLRKVIENKEKEKRDILLADYCMIEHIISDDKLLQSMKYLKEQADDTRQVIRDAKEQSKKGNHEEALRLFREAVAKFPSDAELHEQFAWQLQKEGKLIFEQEKVNVQQARQLLAEYIRLKNVRPSQVHSLFLRFADKITDREEFNLVSFLKLWGLDNLREDDFESFAKDGKTYPSIAEKVVQHGAKLILDKKMSSEVEYFIPFLNKSIQKFQDNIWLPYYKAKLLHLVGRNKEAVEFLIPVVKEKISEYWTWNLLAELFIETDKELALSAYCKALLCKAEDKFIANVRVKFAELLLQKQLLTQAKCEVIAAIKAKEEEGVSVPEKLRTHQQSEWFKNAADNNSNLNFYHQYKQAAEELIFSSLPWINGCLGEVYTVPDKPNKPRRKIYIQNGSVIFEVVISDRKFNTSRGFRIGEAIKLKGEFDKEKQFQIYLLERRDENVKFDIFPFIKGNIVQEIRNDAQKLTGWRVASFEGGKITEGILNLSSLTERVTLKEGSPIWVKYYQKEKPRYLLPSTTKTSEYKPKILVIDVRADGSPWDCFPEYIGVVDHINREKGMIHFIVNQQIDGVIRFNQIKGNIEVGSKLQLKLKKVEKTKAGSYESESYYTVLTCNLTEKDPTHNILKSFSGIIAPNDSVGFVDDVFIDAGLMNEHYEYAAVIKGLAVISYNKKRRTWGWKAIKITG
jgi:tetratricopeptide (TPR) repeat protein